MTQELEPLSQYIHNDHLRVRFCSRLQDYNQTGPEGLSLGADGLRPTTAPPHLNCKRYLYSFLLLGTVDCGM